MSHPAWVCGLKQKLGSYETLHFVTPCVGVWIETPGCGSILIAFGEDNAEVIKTCDIAGKYVRIN